MYLAFLSRLRGVIVLEAGVDKESVNKDTKHHMLLDLLAARKGGTYHVHLENSSRF